MRRSTFITWDQLKVGMLILAALAVLTVAVVKLGQAAHLFSKRYELVTFFPDANGLRVGGSVTVAGLLAGVVKRIEFLPPDGDTTRNLKVTIDVDERLRPLIREDSRTRLRTLGLLGEKVLDISSGTPKYAVLAAGDTLISTPSLDYDVVIAQASGAVSDMVVLTRDLRSITGGIVRGEGTMGQLLTNRSLYDQLNTSITRLNTLLGRLQKPDGTFGRMLDDPTLYEQLTSLTAQMDGVLRQMHSQQNTIGRLLYDDTLYTRLVSASTRADSLLGLLTNGGGLAARLLSDQEVYDKLNKSLTDLNAILEDVRRNPRRYTKGMIKVF